MKDISAATANRPSTSTDPAWVLARATIRAAALLGLSGVTLAAITGMSQATVSRVLSGDRPIDPTSTEGQLAGLLVKVYMALDTLVGNDSAHRMAWMTTENRDLGGVPRELIQSVQGLVRTVEYLDGMRAPA